MFSRGGNSFEMPTGGTNNDSNDMVGGGSNDDDSSNLRKLHRSWLLRPDIKTKKTYKFGNMVISHETVKRSLWAAVIVFLIIAIPTITVKCWPEDDGGPPPPDKYHVGLVTALESFEELNSGRFLNDNNTVGSEFPMSFSITMLSWSVIEYHHKYRAIGQFDHIRAIIKSGTSLILGSFDSSAAKIDKIYIQGCTDRIDSTPDQHNRRQTLEDHNCTRSMQMLTAGADLASEMAAALAAASIVFMDDSKYSEKLMEGASKLFEFGWDKKRRVSYTRDNDVIRNFYNSSGFYDEYIWASAWLYYSTGKSIYLSISTDPSIAERAEAFSGSAQKAIFDWDKKLAGAELLLTRLRMFLNPGFPYETTLEGFHKQTSLVMCSYLERFEVFRFIRGKMIMDRSGMSNLEDVANAAYLASLFVDYLKAASMPGWQCGNEYIEADELHHFATSQVDHMLSRRTSGSLVRSSGFVAALVSLTNSGGAGRIDINNLFTRIPPFSPTSAAPPPPWKPLGSGNIKQGPGT